MPIRPSVSPISLQAERPQHMRALTSSHVVFLSEQAHLHQGRSQGRRDRAVQEALDRGERSAAALQLPLNSRQLGTPGSYVSSDYTSQASCMPYTLLFADPVSPAI